MTIGRRFAGRRPLSLILAAIHPLWALTWPPRYSEPAKLIHRQDDGLMNTMATVVIDPELKAA